MPKWLKISLKILAGFIGLILIIFIALTIYVSYNKKKVLASITKTVNESIDGTLVIGDVDPTFFSGFPGISVSLKNVSLKDKEWPKHHRTLLQAGDVEVAVNALKLIVGVIDVQKISINNAAIDLYTDSAGYSNTAVFGKKKAADNKPKEEGGGTAALIKKIDFNNVSFTMDNRKAFKLFKFQVNKLKGKVNYPSEGWKADLDLNVFAHSMAFNTRKGSFIKDKKLIGPFNIQYNNESQVITVAPNNLVIGDDDFVLGATFDLGKPTTDFKFDIRADALPWSHASQLLAANISKKLNMFALSKPLKVAAIIAGSFSGGGEPKINVNCEVRDNVLNSPGGEVTHCNFDGAFSNNYAPLKEYGDANSAIILNHFSGYYGELPFTADTIVIENFDKPVARGIFKSQFDMRKLSSVMGTETFRFTKGVANLDLKYRADIVDYQFNKPILQGIISVKDADITYVPRNLKLKNTSLSLNFVGNDLLLKNIRLQSGKSVALMEGRVSNFLNLYYNAPEKMLLTWDIHAPEIHLAEFLSILSARAAAKPVKKSRGKQVNFADQLALVFEKGSAELHLRADKVFYRKFLATNATANLLLADNALIIKDVNVKHAGGGLKMNGKITQNGSSNSFLINSSVTDVNISTFFYSFDNFGLSSLTSENLKGLFSTDAHVTGRISNTGDLVPRSVNGVVTFNFKDGQLIKFAPIKSVGKFAFPFRDLDNITFSNLKGRFDLHGDKITVNPLKINSSVLNLDVAGIYSLTTGTNLAIDVPLRNPKDDYKITDPVEREKKRMKGIVIHLTALDGDDGKVKIKLGRNKKKDDDKKKEEEKDKES